MMMPIDLDLSPDALSHRARRRTVRLHTARAFVARRPALSDVIWIPSMHDPGELLETSKGLFNLLDSSGGEPANEIATYWRVAIWAQMAVTRKREGKIGGHWKILLAKIEAAVGSNLKSPWPEIEERLRELPGCVSGLTKSDDAEKRGLKLLDVLMTPKYQKARDALRRYCEIHVYPPAQKHRRRIRDSK
jgi:hypothetical protein